MITAVEARTKIEQIKLEKKIKKTEETIIQCMEKSIYKGLYCINVMCNFKYLKLHFIDKLTKCGYDVSLRKHSKFEIGIIHISWR